ncbi:tryptophan-rich sensory protein [Halobaculum sp. CBA1158]|uniref:TspO/MBR family protein n=1 Tax=Halobaculum sp. CBA1158 TaxID=2904243 RepID=UPI001F3ECD40|nr:TspO/MBR family protein [Halobaculum sp. CBA1158]UIP00160.1 tryptophan-rich sensory protein [Halobaculum sp. CBA1158]
MTDSSPAVARTDSRPDPDHDPDRSSGPRSGLGDRLDGLGGLLALVVAVNVAGAVPALLGGPDTAWFASLTKPAIYPPGWLFGVVWTALFTLSGAALWLVIRAEATAARRLALWAFLLQFAFNVAWTPTFFALREIAAALAVILALAVVLTGTIAAFARVDRRAAALLVPYLAWACFAAVLNYRFLVLN